MKRLLAAVLIFLLLASGLNTVNAAINQGFVYSNIGVVASGGWVEFPSPPIVKNERLLIPIRSVFEKLGAKVEWYPDNQSFAVTLGDSRVWMKIGDKNYLANGKVMAMDVPPVLVNGTAMVPLRFAAEGLGVKVEWDSANNAVIIGNQPLNGIPSRGSTKTGFKVVIDAGHGGSEPGAVYEGIQEKTLNLEIAKKLNDLLDSEGILTFMTREDDSYIDLYTRSGLANLMNADLLISIHNNAGDSGTSGSMSLYYPGTTNSKGNLSAIKFASIVEKHLTGELGTKDLGIIPRPNLAILRTSTMPAVIAEVGYMTNSSELKELKSAEFQQKAAEALKNAVLEALSGI